MIAVRKVLALSTLAFTLSAGSVFAAQPPHDDHHNDNSHYVRHDDWKKGHAMNHDDWNRGDRVDYRQYHLAAPRRGYEWRRVDGNFVMAAVATGVIASIVTAR